VLFVNCIRGVIYQPMFAGAAGELAIVNSSTFGFCDS
jgi:biotin transporter BioY